MKASRKIWFGLQTWLFLTLLTKTLLFWLCITIKFFVMTWKTNLIFFVALEKKNYFLCNFYERKPKKTQMWFKSDKMSRKPNSRSWLETEQYQLTLSFFLDFVKKLLTSSKRFLTLSARWWLSHSMYSCSDSKFSNTGLKANLWSWNH